MASATRRRAARPRARPAQLSRDEQRRLWAPWRSAYITRSAPAEPGCVFCRARRSRDDRRVQVIHRGQHVFAILNKYPYNVGHLMIALNRHVGEFERVRPEEGAEWFQMAQDMAALLKRTVRPQGINLGINMGRIAGAGIPGHLHLHLVPRWSGDTNFMPVVGGAKVMSLSLETLYDVLMKAQRP